MNDRPFPEWRTFVRALWRWGCASFLLLPVITWSAPAPMATPAKRAGGSEITRWLTTADTQWQVDYQRDVAEPYDKGVAEVRKQYLSTLEGAASAATKAGLRENAAAWQAEHDRISSDDATPVPAETKEPAALKTLRTNYRAQLARLERERLERARGLLTRCDAMLAKKQASLPPRTSADDAAKLQKERDDLHTAWLKTTATVDPTPPPPPPGPGGAAGPVKLTSQQILTKLLALGASVAVKEGAGPVRDLKPEETTVQGKFSFVRVSFNVQRPDETPLVVADYDILDSLIEVQELGLSGPVVRDSVMEKLRPFHGLKNLSLNRVNPSPASYAVLPELTELTGLQLQDTNTTDEAMQWVTKCHKLQRLHLGDLPISNEGLANIGELKELQELSLGGLEKIDSKAFAYLADCKALKYVSAGGFIILSGMVENLSHCKNLESISLPNTLLKDNEVASLGALEKLHALDLSNASITGSVFEKWPVRREMTSLNLGGALGVDDAACKGLERAFPKMQDLRLKLGASGFTVVGATALGRLHELRTLDLGGEGITDEIVNELTHAKMISALSIPMAKVTDVGAAAIGRLTQLTSLSLNIPPITDPALKSFGRCKQLKTVNIGKDAAPETEYKLETVLPEVTVNRPEE